MEIRSVPGFPGYSVSEFGEVFHVGSLGVSRCEMDRDAYGYATYVLTRRRPSGNARSTRRRACEIVAAAFGGLNLVKWGKQNVTIRHRDGDCVNDHYSNLVTLATSDREILDDRSLRGYSDAARRATRRERMDGQYVKYEKLKYIPPTRETNPKNSRLLIDRGTVFRKPRILERYAGRRGKLRSTETE